MSYFSRISIRKIKELFGRNSYIDKESVVGRYNFIGKDVAITKSEIGNYCSIAPRVLIGMGEHDLSQVSTSSIFYSDPYAKLTEKPCKIESDVWIGANAIVLRGVHVGIGAVIGAGSVVTRDVPPFAVVVGVPARIIKYRFDELMIKKILLSEWWIYDSDKASKMIRDIS